MNQITRVLLLGVALCMAVPVAFARGSRGGSSSSHASSGGSHSIRGYTTKRGTHVAPSRATNPNWTQRDNYSSKGNVNPSSGKVGTKIPTR